MKNLTSSILLLVVILSQSLPSSCAPSWNSNDAERTKDNPTADQQELQKLLIDGIFKNESNMAVIRKTFRPNTNKICILISYEVNYKTNGTSDDTDCSDINNPFSFYWTRYDPNKSLMRIIATLASTSSLILPVPGFDWDSVCDTNTLSNNPDTTLNIDLYTNTCMEDDDISQALGTITTMVSSESKKLSKQLFVYYAMA